MLSDFVARNKAEIVARSRTRVATRSAPRPTDDELDHGIPLFVDQLAEALRAQTGNAAIGASAARHGGHLLRGDFTIAQVVHDYGDVCQSIMELAVEQEAPVSPLEFKQLNLCLDDAIALAANDLAGRRPMRLPPDGREAVSTSIPGLQ